MTTNRNLFFIVGCQRSGTTMLESILNAHPDVRVIGEEGRASYKYFFNQEDLAEISDPCVGLRIPVSTHELDRAIGHGARVLFMVRDARDVVASMHRAEQDARLQQLYAEVDDRSDVRFGAFVWALKNRYIPMYARSPLPTKIVRYEVLVSQPEPYLRQICEHLGLEWSDRLLEHGKIQHRQVGGHRQDRGDPRAFDRVLQDRFDDGRAAEDPIRDPARHGDARLRRALRLTFSDGYELLQPRRAQAIGNALR
jgi:hypothetical protein